MEKNSEPVRSKEELARILAYTAPPPPPEDWNLIEEGKKIIIDPNPLPKLVLEKKQIDKNIAYIDPETLELRKYASTKKIEKTPKSKKTIADVDADTLAIREQAIRKSNFSLSKFFAGIFIKRKKKQNSLFELDPEVEAARIAASKKKGDFSFFTKNRGTQSFFNGEKTTATS